MADTPPAENPGAPPPKQPPLLEPGDYAQFLLHSRSDIEFVLRGLIDHVSQITMFFNEGADLLLTTLLSFDNQGLVFDLGASTEINRKALVTPKLFCVASLEKVRVQFLLRGLTQTSYEGRPAFRAAMPAEVLRLQRREYFRLTMPVTRPLKCKIPMPMVEGGDDVVVDVNVVDISGGGLAIALPEDMAFEPGAELDNCRVELPEVGTLKANLIVRNQFEITLRSGARVRRAGCEFVKLPGPMLTLVQRYIIKAERERKARESGMV